MTIEELKQLAKDRHYDLIIDYDQEDEEVVYILKNTKIYSKKRPKLIKASNKRAIENAILYMI